MPFDKLETKHIANLIQSDPITCVHYNDHHMKGFQKLCMKDDMIFGPLLDFIFVIEFQNRVSDYDHGLLWVANAPTYGLDSNKIIENFVHKYITCDTEKLTPNFCEVQRYHHKKTCRKKNQAICHFHFPWSRMEETKIIEPIPLGNLSPLEKTRLNEINNKSFDELNKMDLQTTLTMSFTTLLKSISIDKDTYINELKVKFKKPTIFLQRSCKDI